VVHHTVQNTYKKWGLSINMANDIDLQTALGMFVQGSKDLALSRALTQANEQVQAIKMSGVKETDQRLALGSIAQNLVAQMSGIGANAAQVEQARMTYMPKQYQTADQAILDASMTGDRDLAMRAIAADRLSQESAIQLASAREDIATRAQGRAFEQQTKQELLREQFRLKLAETQQENKRPTAEEFKVAGFAKRLGQAESVFSELERTGFDASSVSAAANRNLPNMVRSKEAQKQEQAERNFINAVLRRESGAAISPSEFENAAMQYFPRLGDSPETLAQKRQNRETVIGSFSTEGSRALEKMSEPKSAKALPAGSPMRSYIKKGQ
jgi:hypothetical protein